MATQSAVFKFALPEDEDSNQMLIYSATTKEGTYTLASTVSYEYGISTYEYDSLDDTKWYKIKFNNSTDSEAGPLSDPVYGGTFDNASPFLAVSTGTDGAQYSTTQDVYDYCTLTTADVTAARVSQALRRARAVIDLKTAELDLDRFTRTWDTDPSRKKFNATLRVIKEAEINIALGNIYRGFADDLIAKSMRDELSGDNSPSSNIGIGDASLGGSGDSGDTGRVRELNLVADRYLRIGASMLAAIQPTSVRLHVESDYSYAPKFRYPFNGY